MQQKVWFAIMTLNTELQVVIVIGINNEYFSYTFYFPSVKHFFLFIFLFMFFFFLLFSFFQYNSYRYKKQAWCDICVKWKNNGTFELFMCTIIQITEGKVSIISYGELQWNHFLQVWENRQRQDNQGYLNDYLIFTLVISVLHFMFLVLCNLMGPLMGNEL